MGELPPEILSGELRSRLVPKRCCRRTRDRSSAVESRHLGSRRNDGRSPLSGSASGSIPRCCSKASCSSAWSGSRRRDGRSGCAVCSFRATCGRDAPAAAFQRDDELADASPGESSGETKSLHRKPPSRGWLNPPATAGVSKVAPEGDSASLQASDGSTPEQTSRRKKPFAHLRKVIG